MKETILLIIYIYNKDVTGEDLEVPVDLTANELILALNQIYDLGMKPEYVFNYYLKANNPKGLLRGERTLKEFGVRNGTEIWIMNNDLKVYRTNGQNRGL